MRTIAILVAFTALLACRSEPTITPEQGCKHLANAAVLALSKRNPALYAALRAQALEGHMVTPKTNKCAAEFREAIKR